MILLSTFSSTHLTKVFTTTSSSERALSNGGNRDDGITGKYLSETSRLNLRYEVIWQMLGNYFPTNWINFGIAAISSSDSDRLYLDDG
mmetsp:Transcript_11061/g.16750  ORF Transcript_11061/g.16750 Transcript_11061/m.16750 type:complete len:88 (+) Transcript_11061:754-1017(+)